MNGSWSNKMTSPDFENLKSSIIQGWKPTLGFREAVYHKELKALLPKLTEQRAAGGLPTLVTSDPGAPTSQLEIEPTGSELLIYPYRGMLDGDAPGPPMKPDLFSGAIAMELKVVPFNHKEFCRTLGQVWLYLHAQELAGLIVILIGPTVKDCHIAGLRRLLAGHSFSSPSDFFEEPDELTRTSTAILHWNGDDWTEHEMGGMQE